MCIVCQTISVGAAALTGILPVAVPEPEALQPVTAAVSPNAAQAASIGGTTCNNIGRIRSVAGRSFRCTAVGNRQIWRRSGVAAATTTSVAPTTTTTTIPGVMKASCGGGLPQCPTETAPTVDVGMCKISDASPDRNRILVSAQGFPRPPRAKAGKPVLNVLVIPVRYSNNPITEEQLRNEIEPEFQKAKAFFERNSYKRVTPVFTLESESQWISVAEQADQFIAARNSDLVRVTEDIMSLIPRQNLQDFDSIFIIAAGGKSYWGGGGAVHNVYFQTGPASNIGFPHNLGHTAYYFEDLYIFPTNRTSGQDPNPYRFDVMGSGSDYGGWNRWLAGFLYDSEVICLPVGEAESIHRLTHLNLNSGKKLTVIPLEFGRAMFIEYNVNAIHVYELDSYIEHGAGPMRTIGTLQNGQTLTHRNIELRVLALDQTGAYIRVKPACLSTKDFRCPSEGWKFP